MTVWIPIVEKMPPEREVVIVGQDLRFMGNFSEGHRNFAGWRDGSQWFAYLPHDGVLADMGDVRVTDFWLALPKECPDSGIVRIYPA